MAPTKPVARIRLLDEANAVVNGLSSEDIKRTSDKFAIHAPNYFFNPRYKLGQWDGKIRYFHKTGATYVYLLDEIVPFISKLGYKIEIDDKRVPPTEQVQLINSQIFAQYPHRDTGAPIILRADQVEAVNCLLSEGYGICVAGTGAGKTLACAAVCTQYGKLGLRTLTIVPDTTLVGQTKADYMHLDLDTGEYSGNEKTYERQHVVSTWQALKNNPKLVELFQVVIVDECHGLRGNVLSNIVINHAGPIPYRFGFTGSLPKEETDRMAVRIACGPVRFTIQAHELIDMGVLAKLHIHVKQLSEDLTEPYADYLENESIGTPPTYTQFKDGYFPDFTSEKSYLHHNNERIAWIAELIQQKRDLKKGNVLCLVDSIPLARKLSKLISGAICVNGQDMKKPAKRQEVYNLFKERDDLVVVATIHIAGVGLSINRIFNFFFVDVGKSFIRVIQGIGRGLRKAPDKDSVDVYDICSDLKYGKRHLANRLTYYKEAKYPHTKQKIAYNQAKTLDQ